MRGIALLEMCLRVKLCLGPGSRSAERVHVRNTCPLSLLLELKTWE